MKNLPFNLYLAAQVRECEQIAINEFGIQSLHLMQNAATSLWTVVQQRWSKAKKIAVFCGAGNNGGDGYFLATFALKAGLEVIVYRIEELTQLTGDAQIACETYQQAGGRIALFEPSLSNDAELIVDALLGTGLNREVTGSYAEAIKYINQADCPVLAVDIPSGLHADTGKTLTCAVQADVTVSFVALKQGMFTGDGVTCTGEILYADLAIPTEVFKRVLPSAQRLKPVILPRRLRNTHKGSYGHVLVIGGDRGFSGAVRLAAEAALRTGAGLVSVATHPDHAHTINSGRFELMVHGVENMTQLAPLLDKASVIVLGTGLGQQAWGAALFVAAITQQKPLVIDADALSLLVKHPHYQPNQILTPHPGEAARLLFCSTQEIAANRFAAVQKIQANYGGVCLLKGAGTLLADGQGISVLNAGNPGMASGGMGDVLSGVIGGLLAQGLSLTQATEAGAYIHSTAADLAAAELGERGLLAGDLMPYLRRLVN